MNPMMAAKAYATVQGGAMPTATLPSAASAAQGPGFEYAAQGQLGPCISRLVKPARDANWRAAPATNWQ